MLDNALYNKIRDAIFNINRCERLFSAIYPYIHRIMNISKRARVFITFFLLAALLWLILAAVVAGGLFDYHRAAMIVPEMIRSAAFSVPLSIAAGLIIDAMGE